jgi:ketosteroid isomerase-like protein
MPEEIGSIPGLDLVREKLVSGFERRDYPALGALFAANAVLLPPGRPIINDSDAVRQFWASIGEQVKAIALEPLGIRPLGGDAAREVGRIRMTVGDQSPQTVLNKYLLLWQRTAENWLIEGLVWNRVRLGQGGGRPRPNRQGGQKRRQTIQDLYEG